MDDDKEDVTELNLEVDTSGIDAVTPLHDDDDDGEEPETLQRAPERRAPKPEPWEEPLPADEEFPTALVPPNTLKRELERSRKQTDPHPAKLVRPVLAALERERPLDTPSTAFPLVDPPRLRAMMDASLAKGRQELPTAPADFPIVALPANLDAAAGAGRTVPIPRSTLAQVLAPRPPHVTVKVAALPPAVVPVVAAPRPAATVLPPKRRSRVVLQVLVVVVVALVAAGVTAHLEGVFPP